MSTRGSAATEVPQDERELIAEFSRGVVERVAPEELVVYDETASEFVRDPGSVVGKARDEAVGFGLDAGLDSSVVLAVMPSVLIFLKQVVLASVEDGLKDRLTDALKRLLGTGDSKAGDDEPPALTKEQLQELRRVALTRAGELGVEDGRAALLADAIVGGMVTDGDPDAPPA